MSALSSTNLLLLLCTLNTHILIVLIIYDLVIFVVEEGNKKSLPSTHHLLHFMAAPMSYWTHSSLRALNYTVSFLVDFLLVLFSPSNASYFGKKCLLNGSVELFLTVIQNCVVLAYQMQSCYTKPLNPEIRPFTPVLPGFPCQIFIEAETLYDHLQSDGGGHKQASRAISQTGP